MKHKIVIVPAKHYQRQGKMNSVKDSKSAKLSGVDGTF